MDYNNLVVLQFFGLVLGVAVLIIRTAEFGVNFMLNFSLLQYCIFSSNPLLDKSVFLVTSAVALLARRLVDLFLNIGIRFGFGSFGTRTGMAGPVIANDFRRRSAALLRRGIVPSSDSRRGTGNQV
jgi:hypothetical protein